MLIKVKWQNWEANFSYAPPTEDAVINTDDVARAVPAESRGSGPFTRVTFRDGSSMTVLGTPEQFLVAESKPLAPGLTRVVLDLDEWDRESLVSALGTREAWGFIPDGQGNANARIVAEICRGWLEMVQAKSGPDATAPRLLGIDQPEGG